MFALERQRRDAGVADTVANAQQRRVGAVTKRRAHPALRIAHADHDLRAARAGARECGAERRIAGIAVVEPHVESDRFGARPRKAVDQLRMLGAPTAIKRASERSLAVRVNGHQRHTVAAWRAHPALAERHGVRFHACIQREEIEQAHPSEKEGDESDDERERRAHTRGAHFEAQFAQTLRERERHFLTVARAYGLDQTRHIVFVMALQNLQRVEIGQRANALGQFRRFRHLCTVHQNRNGELAGLQRGLDFAADKILGIIQPALAAGIDAT